ncbi:hypothetical protein [Streptomyces youssoufiensis]
MAVPRASSRSGATGGAAKSQALSIAVTRTASIRWRSEVGSTWRMVARARSAASAMPATVTGAVWSATAMASAWSSSKSNGGSRAPAPSR